MVIESFGPDLVREELEARGFGVGSVDLPGIVASRTDIGFGLDVGDLAPRLERYSFRKLLRYLISRGDSWSPTADLERSVTPPCLEAYATLLEAHGLLTRGEHGWRMELNPPPLPLDHPNAAHPRPSITDFGPTLEWCVADAFSRRLHWAADWHIQLESAPCNDFDVVAVRGSLLAVVECKAQRARDVDEGDVAMFVERHQYIGASLSILLVDTDEAVDKLAHRVARRCYPVRNDLAQEVPGGTNCAFRSVAGLYVVRGEKGLHTGIGLCLQDYSRRKAKHDLYEL